VLYIIGVGPGDPELITVKGLRILRECSVIAGWGSVVKRFSDLVSGKRLVLISYSTLERDLELIASLARDGCVALLVHGDPSVSDWQLMGRLRDLCVSGGIECTVVPGVSSLNAALAREGLDMAEIVFVSLHAEGGEGYYEEILKALSIGRKVVVFPEPYPDGPQRVARYLLSRGFRGRAKVYEDLTLPSEAVHEYSLEELAMTKREFSDLCVVVIKPQAWPR